MLEVIVAAEGGVVSAEELLEARRGTSSRIRSPTPCASRSRACVNAWASPGSSPPCPASATASTGPDRDARAREGAWIERRELSVRLKLTLSYAGFLMLAGVLMLAAVCGDLVTSPTACSSRTYIRSGGSSSTAHLLPASARSRRSCWHACWCSASWVAGCSPAACLPRWPASPKPRARPRTDRSPIGSGWKAARTSSASSRTLRRHARPPRSPRRRAATIRSQRLPRAPHAARDHADPPRRRPQRSEPRRRRARRTPPCRESPGDRAHRSTLLLSRADQRSFDREPVDLSLVAEEAAETLLPWRKSAGSRSRPRARTAATIGSRAPSPQMTTNLVQNAIVHNLAEHGQVGSGPAIGPGASSSGSRTPATNSIRSCRRHARRAVSSRGRAHPRRPRRCWPRPGNRQEHRPGTRRSSRDHSAARRRPQSHRRTQSVAGHGRRAVPERVTGLGEQQVEIAMMRCAAGVVGAPVNVPRLQRGNAGARDAHRYWQWC